jgi:GT2 family glycosyltransferase
MISAVIPTYGGGPRLTRYLPGVRASLAEAGEPYEIVVVDDGGGGLPPLGDDVVIEALPVNRGFAPAVNAGIARARGEWLLLLNDDVHLERETVRRLRARFAPESDLFAVVPAIRSPLAASGDEGGKRGRWHAGLLEIDEHPADADQPTLYPVGCCLLCPRARLRALGGFAEVYAPFFWEDVELGYRAWRQGWRVLHVPDAVCHHEGSATLRSTYDEAERERVWFRNRVLFHLRNVREPERRAAVFGALAAFVLLDPRETRRQAVREALERYERAPEPHEDGGLTDTAILARAAGL